MQVPARAGQHQAKQPCTALVPKAMCCRSVHIPLLHLPLTLKAWTCMLSNASVRFATGLHICMQSQHSCEGTGLWNMRLIFSRRCQISRAVRPVQVVSVALPSRCLLSADCCLTSAKADGRYSLHMERLDTLCSQIVLRIMRRPAVPTFGAF